MSGRRPSPGPLTWPEQDIDLTATTRSIIELQPGMGDARLDEWFTALGASQAYPGALGASFMDAVPRSELVNWDKALDSALHVSQAGLPPVVPAGSRPYYCLQSYLAYPNGGADCPDRCSGRLPGPFGLVFHAVGGSSTTKPPRQANFRQPASLWPR